MPLSYEDVRRIAHLARLAIREEDLPSYVQDLSSILTLVEQMNEVNTAGVSPMSHPLDVEQRLREDVVTEVNERDKFQRLAPSSAEGFYLVPKVIE